MAEGKRFAVPSIEDMEVKSHNSKVPSLFASHRSELQANIKGGKSKEAEHVTEEPKVDKRSSESLTSRLPTVNTQTAPSQKSTSHENLQKGSAVCTTGGITSTVDKIKPVMDKQPSTESKPGPPGPGKTNSIIVSPRQRGNPILKAVRNVPWEFGDIVADYQMGQTTCALFLSLRYHQLNPNYIHERLKQLGHSYDLRVLLVNVDEKDPHHSIKELAKMSILADCTLILAFSAEEAGRYLETFKAFENKPPDLIMEKTEAGFQAQMVDCLTSVRRVNKTDAMTLMTKFGSFEKIVETSEDDISLCSGFGPQKAKKLYSVLHEPFLKSKKAKVQATGSAPSSKHSGKSSKTTQPS